MTRRIRLFITATQDLEEEREVIAHVVAQLPTSIGWEIGRVHRGEDPLEGATQAIRRSSLYLFLLGCDINAPAGVEWDIARRAGKKAFGYRKAVLRTQAAEAFARSSGIRWTPFQTSAQLGQLVRGDLIDQLRQEALRFGLSAVDLQTLESAQSEPPPQPSDDNATADRRAAVSGAAAGGVVLGPGDRPRGGVLVRGADQIRRSEEGNEDLAKSARAAPRPADS